MTRAHRFALPPIVIVVLSAITPSLAAQRAFEGVYIASGVDSGGSEYKRAVEIERVGDRYVVTWVSVRHMGEALVLEPTRVGVGLVTDEILSVSFVAEDAIGIMVYRFGPNGQLSGRWTLEGDDEEICSETLTPLTDVLPTPAAVDPHWEERSHPSAAPAIGSEKKRAGHQI